MFRKYFGFLVVSAGGLMIAVAGLWTGSVVLGLPVFHSNVAADCAAVTFVFFASAYKTFSHEHHFMTAKFTAYLLWQAIHIPLASWLVAALSQWPVLVNVCSPYTATAVSAKLLITPLTVTANFLVAGTLLERLNTRQVT